MHTGFNHESKVVVLTSTDQQYWLDLRQEWRSKTKEEKEFILKNYIFIFILEEGIEPYETQKWMEILVSYGCRVHSQAFISQSLKLYFDKKYPNNKFTCARITDNIHMGYHKPVSLSQKDSWNYFKSLNNERDFLIKFFTFRTQPQRDSVWMMLRDSGLLNKENTLFCKTNPVDGWKSVTVYNNYDWYSADKTIHDYEWLDNTFFSHPSQEKIELTDNNKQDDGLFNAHLNTYFDILTETIVPLENHPFEIVRNQTGLSKRTFYPLVCRNVFHIYPKNKPLEDLLKSMGIELFFNNHQEFLDNLNVDFYKDSETQRKLNNNQKIIIDYMPRNFWM